MSIQSVFVIGATGNVGSELLRQIYQFDVIEKKKRHQNPTRVIGIANSRGYVFERGGISRDQILSTDQWPNPEFEAVQAAIGSYVKSNLTTYKDGLTDLINLVDREGLNGDVIFVDVTAEKEELLKFHKQVIESHDRLVTANKNPVALFDMDSFRKLTRLRSRYGMRAALMAGADAISHLFDLYDVSEPVVEIEGCFSGSLGFICTQLEEGRAFSEVLRDCVRLRYTEPDPRDDLSGLDVARKLVIVARCLNLDVELERKDVQVDPFIDLSQYHASLSVTEFLNKVESEDEQLRERFLIAKEKKQKLKYVAKLKIAGEKPVLTVRLQEIESDSALYTLRGSSNMISIVTEKFKKDKPYIIQSPGAGNDITATGIRRDLLQMLHGRAAGNYPIAMS